MNLPLPSMLLGLGVKSVLGWGLVFHQRSHLCSSFLGVFAVSLSLIDTALALLLAVVRFHPRAPLVLPGLQLTSYNACLLVQILGQVCNALQWPVALVAALDHLCAVSLRLASPGAKRVVYSLASALLWTLAALYVFLLSGFSPVLDDVPHWRMRRCWVAPAPQVLQVAALLSCALACAALHALCGRERIAKRGGAPSGRSEGAAVRRLCVFLTTWAPLLVLLAVLLLLPAGIPSHLGLNGAWLCLLNSALIALVLCVASPGSPSARGLAAVPADSFCEWRVQLSPAAEDGTGRHPAV